ncbi:hypothetical protein K2X30_13375 [bacterium]|nr:hypothetical protein [bacterium]
MKCYRKAVVLLSLTAATFAGCAKQDAREDRGASTQPTFAAEAQSALNLAELMQKHSQAIVKPQPWASNWWPYGSAGIASGGYDPQGMSPAEKYDTAYKVYYEAHGGNIAALKSAASWERSLHSPSAFNFESWFGHCNGWAAAALLVPEPRESKTINGVTFAVRDQKALLSESWLEFSGDFIGTRANDKGDTSSAAFWDIAPAQFHLILANIVSRQNKGVVFDRYTGDQVWNQPLVAFRTDPIQREDYLGPHPQFPEIHRVNVSTTIWWAEDNVHPDAITPEFDIENENVAFFPMRKLRYELWLDGPPEFDSLGRLTKSGDILITSENSRYYGGAWKNGTTTEALLNSHPDYMWVPLGVQFSTGYKNPNIDDGWIRDFIGAPGGNSR